MITQPINELIGHTRPMTLNKTFYHDIPKEISFKEFDFDNYYNDEQTKLRPQFEKLGFTNISFKNGETDSFGPLTRVIRAEKYGKIYYFVYG